MFLVLKFESLKTKTIQNVTEKLSMFCCFYHFYIFYLVLHLNNKIVFVHFEPIKDTARLLIKRIAPNNKALSFGRSYEIKKSIAAAATFMFQYCGFSRHTNVFRVLENIYSNQNEYEVKNIFQQIILAKIRNSPLKQNPILKMFLRQY